MKKIIGISLLMLSLTVFIPIKAHAELKLPEEPGTYPVETEYTEDSESAKRTFYVTVTTKNTVIEGQSAIDAKAFELRETEVADLTEKEILNRSQAKAWSTKDGQLLSINHVDFSELRPTQGSYTITLGVSDQVKKTLKIKVVATSIYKQRLSISSHWFFRLVITGLLVIALLVPLGLILWVLKNMTNTLNQLLAIFQKNSD